ncbi:MAG: HAD family hydrolase [Candidatus Kapaibacterium sp.]
MKAVLFDLFGTLVDNPTIEQVSDLHGAVAETLGVSLEDFRDGWRKTYRERAEGAHASMAESIARAAGYAGAAYNSAGISKAVRIRHDVTRSWLVPRADALETLSGLRARHFKIGLLSNCTSEVPEIWPELPFAGLFEVPLFSSRELVRKPMPEFYRRALMRLDVSPFECLFIADGDNGELAAATALGMPAVMIRPAGMLNDYRQDPEEDWEGPRIERLSELLQLTFLQEG